jgi:predicted ATPase
MLCDQGRFADATALLQPVYDRFTEGFGTADLKAAEALLEAAGKSARRDGGKAGAASGACLI